ncbi:MAG: hypothetical protein V5A62_08335 [Haloarculaceae archaeon]
MARVRVLHTTLALLVVLAGCSGFTGGGTPTPTGHDLSISISNEHDVGYEVRVTAVPARVEGIEVTYENSTTHRFDVASFDALPETALRNATAIATTDFAELSREFTVGPNEGIGTTVDGVPANATVVYFVLRSSGPSTVRGEGVVRCSPDTENTELAVTVRPDGSLHSAVTCSDDPERYGRA